MGEHRAARGPCGSFILRVHLHLREHSPDAELPDILPGPTAAPQTTRGSRDVV